MNAPAPQRADAELLSIGDELLYGDILDTNQAWLAQQLLPLGVRVRYSQTVGDEIADIVAAFKLAISRAQVVIVTGGLGPTADDLTIEALAKALGVELELHEEVMDQMAERLKRPKEQFSASNRKQAYLPQGAAVLRNHWGTAPGVHARAGHVHVFLMPGVPREMKGIYGHHVEPVLKREFPAPRVILRKYLYAFGIPESRVGERMMKYMAAGSNPIVGTKVSDGIIGVRVVAEGADESAARQLLDEGAAFAREQLKEGLFAEDDGSIAAATGRALLANKRTVAFAESCTAGLASAMLAEVPGISAALLEGAVVYSSAAKVRACGVKKETLDEHGAVSAETARELAEGIRARSGADIAVGVTGVAGPDGGTDEKPVGLVYFALATKDRTVALRRLMAGYDRQTIRERSAAIALDLVRRAALGLAAE